MPIGARGRHMGLDVGDRRIGVALSDETATLASALTTVTRVGGRKDAAAVADLARAVPAWAGAASADAGAVASALRAC